MTKPLSEQEKAARALKKRQRQADQSWHATFLTMLAETNSVRYACQAARISRSTAYEHRDLFPEFARQWDEARADALDALIATARSRALQGSDLLLMFLIKQGDPTYRDNFVLEHTTPADRPLEITTPDLKRAQDEIAQWRAEQKSLIEALLTGPPMPPSSLPSVPPTRPTSPTTTGK